MIKAEEIGHIILGIIIAGLVMSFGKFFGSEFSVGFAYFLWALVLSGVVVLVNVFTKKVVAYLLDSDMENKVWSWQRYWFYEKSYFKKKVPLGFLLPLLLSIASLGYIKFLGILEYDVYASKARASKRIGNVRFSELTESHIGAVGGFGILANLVVSLLAYILSAEEIAKFNIYYAFANILPISGLDGAKIFFGSRVAWFVLAILSGMALVFSLTTL